MSDTGRRLVLVQGERTRVLDELDHILARTATVAEHLQVAAARNGTSVSAWTTDQLDAILDAVRALHAAAERTPLLPD